MVGSYTNVFGGTAVRPSNPSYLALTIAVNTALAWPLETMEGVPYVAAQIDVTASATGLSLAMPPANNGTPGAQSIITNVGADSFTLTDNAGDQICIITAGVSWLVTLTGNATVAGTWRAYQLAATTSSASAGSLAGYGLDAISATLNAQLNPVTLDANTTLVAADRAAFVTWTGGAGTLALDTLANLTQGWFCYISNQGTGSVALTPSDSQMINGAASLSIGVGNSTLISAGPTAFSSALNFNFPLPIADGGTGATSATEAVTNLGASAIGSSIFTAPSAASVVALLGISSATFTESSVSTNQSITAASSGTAFVCTQSLTMTLPLTTGGGNLTKSFNMLILAEGGAVTLTPQSLDSINGGTAGTSFVLSQGQSCLLMTDINGNWYLLLLGVVQSGAVTAGNGVQWSANGTLADTGAKAVSFATGTALVFAQAAAPTGWTISAAHNDMMLRVNGTAGGGTGGSWAISGVTITVGGHALALSEIPTGITTLNDPGHSHNLLASGGGFGGFDLSSASSPQATWQTTGGAYHQVSPTATQSASTGITLTDHAGGGTHTHTGSFSNDSTWRPAYLDTIICTKN